MSDQDRLNQLTKQVAEMRGQALEFFRFVEGADAMILAKVAAAVTAEVTAIQTALANIQTAITTLEGQITTLQTEVTALNTWAATVTPPGP